MFGRITADLVSSSNAIQTTWMDNDVYVMPGNDVYVTLGNDTHVTLDSDTHVALEIIIMVIFKRFFSREHIALSYKKLCEHRIRKNQQIKSIAHDGKSYLK